MKPERPSIGILVSNLGTPDAPTPAALKRYLREFLKDPRVIDLPRWKWIPLLELLILPRRSPKSAEAYGKVWTPEGSPLLSISKRQRALLEEMLKVPVALGMRYGNPSIATALDELLKKGCGRLLVLPLYPQYAAATTASTFDALGDALKRLRVVPEIRTVCSYHDEPLYIGALARSIREVWEKDGAPKRLLLSFHGLPRRYVDLGDPYRGRCEETARLLAAELGFPCELAFQSRFGREEWLKPYTDETLTAWGRDKLESVDVVCPGFSADCLETIEEIDQQNREFFQHAGGGRFRYIPALNDRRDHVAALAAVARRNLAGWIQED
ncbi:MAG TPA: ferrochelatase [Planctomycetota bacterium]|nr:ferrochelatase [Planctomycetota bacterium]